MFLVGLTGGMASGKTTAIAMFKALGAPVIDTDQIATDVVQPGRRAWKKIKEQFGEKVFFSNGHLDQETLGQQIFSDAKKRTLLDAITHPEIHRIMMLQLFACFLKGHQFVVVDLPMLFEFKNMISCNVSFTVVVSCEFEQQVQRLMKRNQLSEEQANIRINTQMELEEKCRRATFIVDNSGTEEMTEKQILDLYHLFKRSTAHWPLRILGWTTLTILSWTMLKCLQFWWF